MTSVISNMTSKSVKGYVKESQGGAKGYDKKGVCRRLFSKKDFKYIHPKKDGVFGWLTGCVLQKARVDIGA